MAAPLSTTVATGDANHATLHNQERAALNTLSGIGLATVRAKLDLGLSAVIGIFSDSTADDATDWPQLVETLIGTARPELTIINRQWTDGTQAYGAVNTKQTGATTNQRAKTATPTAAQTLTFYTGAVAGTTFAYQSTRVAALLPVAPDLVIFSSSHNYNAGDVPTYTAEIESLAVQVATLYPNAGIVLSSQNPEFTSRPDTNIVAHAARNAALRPLAEKHRWGYIPITEAFLALSDRGQSLVSADGTHPTTTATTGGQAFWANAWYAWFTSSLDGDVVASTGGGSSYTDEQAQDAIGSLISAGTQSGITVAYDDAAAALNFTVTASSVPAGQDTASVLSFTTADETISREAAGTTLASPSGRLSLTFYTARTTVSRTGIQVVSGTTAAGATPTLIRFGLYEVSTDGLTATLVASTPNDTTLLAAANANYTKAFTTPYTVTAGKRYGLGFLCSTSATAPNLPGGGPQAGSNAALWAPIKAGWIGSQSDLPATVTISALSGTNTFLARVT